MVDTQVAWMTDDEVEYENIPAVILVAPSIYNNADPVLLQLGKHTRLESNCADFVLEKVYILVVLFLPYSIPEGDCSRHKWNYGK